MASLSPQQEALRLRLSAFYHRVLAKGQPLHANHAKTFLDSLVQQPDPVHTLQRLSVQENGLLVLTSAIWSQASVHFLNEQATSVLVYLQDEQLRAIQAGYFLQDIVWRIVEPPFFWNAYVREFRAEGLNDRAAATFGWLLLQLLCLPSDKARKYHQTASDPEILGQLQQAENRGVACNYRKIKFVIDAAVLGRERATTELAGWRHDNDYSDFRQISILPTPSELRCADIPFLRPASEISDVDDSTQFAVHIDNQFRLLREDMMRELREELQSMQHGKDRKRPGIPIRGLALTNIKTDAKHPWSLEFSCKSGLPGLSPGMAVAARQEYVQRKRDRFFRHESLCCLMVDNSPVILGYIDRDDESLAADPPILCVRFDEDAKLKAALRAFKLCKNISLLQLSTAAFAYTPVLRQLQRINWLPLGEEIVHSERAMPVLDAPAELEELLTDIDEKRLEDLGEALELPQSTILDPSQRNCFVSALTQRISLIQGPPGTGKSFIGALITKAICMYTSHQILVVCRTNHVLDQFLQDLRDVGIPDEDMVRIGSVAKTSATNQDLGLASQLRGTSRLSLNYDMLDQHRSEAVTYSAQLSTRFDKYNEKKLSIRDLKDQSELDLDHPEFHGAFDVFNDEIGMNIFGKNRKRVDEFYLLERWCSGKDPGIFPEAASTHPDIWKMTKQDRTAIYTKWKDDILEERAIALIDTATALNNTLAKTSRIFGDETRALLRTKRVVACTTTSAAKYAQDVQASGPAVVLVQEAGEIHEAHVLTALGPHTHQLVLIGDHQQLRPKVHYDLSVAKGEGFDLDVSLFERLVLKGYPHQTLTKQHRMRPQISNLVKALTYHDLKDATSTLGRPHIKGLQSDLVFINHSQPEDETIEVKDVRDPTTGSSKGNIFEAQMTLKCIKYLGQQGYGTEDIVVLTPYLSQLRLLLDFLAKENDAVLNDLDFHDLVSAGPMPTTLAKEHKRQLRLSTIDNYQGEQSDIFVISLARRNEMGDIEFLTSPERLNALLSRARNGTILIGNSENLLRSEAHSLWPKLFNVINKSNAFFEGLPVVCAQHPDRKRQLSTPLEFDTYCPDGGCDKPWYARPYPPYHTNIETQRKHPSMSAPMPSQMPPNHGPYSNGVPSHASGQMRLWAYFILAMFKHKAFCM